MIRIDQLPPYVWNEDDLPPPSYDIHAAEMAVRDLPPEKLAEFNRGVAEALSDDKAEPYLLTAAQNAVIANEGIELIFASLTDRLTKIDRMSLHGDHEPFEPQLAVIKHVSGISLDTRRPTTVKVRDADRWRW